MKTDVLCVDLGDNHVAIVVVPEDQSSEVLCDAVAHGLTVAFYPAGSPPAELLRQHAKELRDGELDLLPCNLEGALN